MASEVLESLCFQAFRSYIQEFGLPVGGHGQGEILLVGRLHAVDEQGGDAYIVQRVDLILHEGDKR